MKIEGQESRKSAKKNPRQRESLRVRGIFIYQLQPQDNTEERGV